MEETIFIPIEQLYEPYYNPRKHPEKQVYNLSLSLKEFGQRRTISVWPDGKGKFEILAGNGIKKAAEFAKLAGLNCTLAPADWPEIRRKAYAQADNQGGYEDDQLAIANILQEILNDGDIPLEALGSSQEELDALLSMLAEDALGDMPEAGAGGDEFDTTPEEGPTRSKLGDLWQLGKHRLLVGDSTKPDDLKRLFQGEKAKLMATDPPYVVDYKGGSHPTSKSNQGASNKDKDWSDKYHEVEIKDAHSFFSAFLSAALAEALIPKAAIYVWHASARQVELGEAMDECGILAHQQIIWVKSRPVLTYSHYMWKHEPCLYGWKEGFQPEKRPPPNETTIWEVDSKIEDGAKDLHPTMKPLELFRRPMEFHTEPGDLCFEPFTGSGTSIIAAERTNRRCYGIEIEPKFADVILRRFEAESGETAKLLERLEQPELAALEV
jgi:DNA modification methylase